MILTQHGGNCCGMTHMRGFGYGPTDESAELFNQQVATFKRNNPSRILEVTLTDNQMNNGWAPHLKKAGFKIVNRFVNSNSFNVVNVLHLNSSDGKRVARYRQIPEPPFKW